MKDEKIKSIIESLLFVSGDPLKLKKIAQVIGIKKEKLNTLVEMMEKEYQSTQRGITLIRLDDKLQLVTVSQNVPYVKKLIKNETESKLSPAARETLAIIAYRGPLTRAQIDLIRGVNSSFILRNLMIRGLIERKENRDEKIKGYLYQVTTEFLKGLGITSLNELPQYEELRNDKKAEELLKEIEQGK